MLKDKEGSVNGHVFNIQRCSFQDGYGIRTTVFFKGCPLRCWWCSNPESQTFSQEIAHYDLLCNGCGNCVEMCELKCISLSDKKINIERSQCTNCGECIRVCHREALVSWGKKISVSEVMAEVEMDYAFYRNSCGGLTASGGEPLAQPAFLKALFKASHARGISTTLDTSGYSDPDVVKEIIEDTDLVLFDLKHMDSSLHMNFTGAPNESILQNLKMMAEKKNVKVILRIPLIPTVNISEDNIKQIIKLALWLDIGQIDLLPYHQLGKSKYGALDRPYRVDIDPPRQEVVKNLSCIIEGSGLRCNIGG